MNINKYLESKKYYLSKLNQYYTNSDLTQEIKKKIMYDIYKKINKLISYIYRNRFFTKNKYEKQLTFFIYYINDYTLSYKDHNNIIHFDFNKYFIKEKKIIHNIFFKYINEKFPDYMNKFTNIDILNIIEYTAKQEKFNINKIIYNIEENKDINFIIDKYIHPHNIIIESIPVKNKNTNFINEIRKKFANNNNETLYIFEDIYEKHATNNKGRNKDNDYIRKYNFLGKNKIALSAGISTIDENENPTSIRIINENIKEIKKLIIKHRYKKIKFLRENEEEKILFSSKHIDRKYIADELFGLKDYLFEFHGKLIIHNAKHLNKTSSKKDTIPKTPKNPPNSPNHTPSLIPIHIPKKTTPKNDITQKSPNSPNSHNPTHSFIHIPIHKKTTLKKDTTSKTQKPTHSLIPIPTSKKDTTPKTPNNTPNSPNPTPSFIHIPIPKKTTLKKDTTPKTQKPTHSLIPIPIPKKTTPKKTTPKNDLTQKTPNPPKKTSPKKDHMLIKPNHFHIPEKEFKKPLIVSSKKIKNFQEQKITIIPSIYFDKDKLGDFSWEIKFNKRGEDTLYIFNDNYQDHKTAIQGGGNAIIRTYNKYSNYRKVSSIGISTGFRPGYPFTKDDKWKEIIDKEIEEIKELLKTGKYNKLVFSSTSTKTKTGKFLLGVDIFSKNIDPDILTYIPEKIFKELNTVMVSNNFIIINRLLKNINYFNYNTNVMNINNYILYNIIPDYLYYYNDINRNINYFVNLINNNNIGIYKNDINKRRHKQYSILKYLNNHFVNNIHIPLLYDSIKIKNIKLYFSQYFDNNLFNFIDKQDKIENFHVDIIINMIKQLFMATISYHTKTGLINTNINHKNIFYNFDEIIEVNTYICYKLYDKLYYINYNGYIWYLTDFSESIELPKDLNILVNKNYDSYHMYCEFKVVIEIIRKKFYNNSRLDNYINSISSTINIFKYKLSSSNNKIQEFDKTLFYLLFDKMNILEKLPNNSTNKIYNNTEYEIATKNYNKYIHQIDI